MSSSRRNCQIPANSRKLSLIMEDLAVSRTALATSLMRAAHTRLDPHPLIDDAWGDRLVPEHARDMLRQAALARLSPQAREAALASPGAIVDESLRRSPAYANVITRTRFAEDALQAAVQKGIRHYVLIGAGFDSFALRRPRFAAELEIFEIDFPATQELKRERIEACGLTLPDSVHFIPADLSRETVADALARSPFLPRELTFFSWLGVTMYLTREANLATLRSIASCAPAGSELVFTYFDERLREVQSEAFNQLQRRVAALGEPFLSGFDPTALRRDLDGCGLELLEDLTGAQVAAKYHRGGNDGLRSSSFSHIALAQVSGRKPNAQP
jgi:methyltransferase (TIGR00027 family)